MDANNEQPLKHQLSKSSLYGYRKPLADEDGDKWCHCTIPTLTRPYTRGIAHCKRCDTPYYH